MTDEHLKILFITSWYPTHQQPLRGVFVREQAKAAALYDDVVVLHCAGLTIGLATVSQYDQETDPILTEGIPTYRCRHRISPVPKTSYLVYLWSAIRAFWHIDASGFRPDVIHAHIYEASVPAILLGKWNGIPVVITEHSSAFLRGILAGSEIRKARFAFRRARWVMPVSGALQRSIERYGIQARFRVVPNVVDVSLFALRAQPREIHDPKQLLFVGSLVPTKGVSYLLQALAQLRQKKAGPRWQMHIVGDGPHRQTYERQAAELGLDDSVIFHGARSKPSVAEFMHRSDLFVLPSLAETFSVVTAEALAAGLPVLATASGGPEEFVTSDVGLLVPPGDVGALQSGLSRMLNDLNRYSSKFISEYAINRFSPRKVGETLHAIYRSVV